MIQLSFSACQKYLASPISWYLHYMLRLRPTMTGSALVFGASLDAGFNVLLEALRDGREPSVDLAKAAFDVSFEAFNPFEIKYSKADYDDSILPEGDLGPNPPSWYCLKYKGYILIEEYFNQVIPKIEKVYAVQKNISLKNELGDEFTGVIDFIAQINGQIWIIDNKSSSIKYAKDAVANSGQLSTYYEAMRDEYNLAGACFIVVPKNLRKKKLPVVDIEFVFGEIPETLIEKTFQDYENVLSGIKLGKFECSGCNKNPWPCPYATYCRSNGTDLTGLKYVDKK